MEVLQFIAPNAAAALEQIHKQLGPDAVVLSVRPLPAQGLSQFLPGKKRIEVLAGVPTQSSPAPTAGITTPQHHLPQRNASAGFQSIAWLESNGLLPVHAQRLESHVRTVHGSTFDSLETEWAAVSTALSEFWRDTGNEALQVAEHPHVFIGPPGSGKTTALCKWLTLSTLLEDRPARVFRLDSSHANTADYLTIHCEMLGVPVERFWKAPVNRAEVLFVDLPGIDPRDPVALRQARDLVAALPDPQVHLVLNAAYEVPILLKQIEAFAPLQPRDLTFTHLDEEPRRAKLWNFVMGTSLPIRFLSASAKIPGEFQRARPELLFAETLASGNC